MQRWWWLRKSVTSWQHRKRVKIRLVLFSFSQASCVVSGHPNVAAENSCSSVCMHVGFALISKRACEKEQLVFRYFVAANETSDSFFVLSCGSLRTLDVMAEQKKIEAQFTCMLQILYRTGSPRQPCGAWHRLNCCAMPPSQDREHVDQSDHVDQPTFLPLPRFSSSVLSASGGDIHEWPETALPPPPPPLPLVPLPVVWLLTLLLFFKWVVGALLCRCELWCWCWCWLWCWCWCCCCNIVCRWSWVKASGAKLKIKLCRKEKEK